MAGSSAEAGHCFRKANRVKLIIKVQTVLYLIRHGEYENPHALFHGRLPGFPLSPKGRKAAAALAKLLEKQPIVAVYSSPLKRAFVTAEIIAKAHSLAVKADDRLLDIRTPFEGKSIAFMESIDWNFYRPEFVRQGSEMLSEIFNRMDDFIREKVRQNLGKQIVAVSHGDPIMSIWAKYTGKVLYTRRVFLEKYVSMTSGYKISFGQGKRPHILSFS